MAVTPPDDTGPPAGQRVLPHHQQHAATVTLISLTESQRKRPGASEEASFCFMFVT